MRNLSKVLALVLALALAMTMFSGAIDTTKPLADAADLSDAGKEAVAVLSALGIVTGYEETDGTYTFKGASLVTRAEYAAMITRAKTGDTAASFYAVASLPFKDAFDTWELPYLNYCYLNEIMVGYGDGYMLPKGNVTGVEAIKMALVALGYEPKIEGLEGSNWIANTISLASRIGLLKNLESKQYNAAFDREANAILIKNALYTNTVYYVGNSAFANEYTLGVEVFDLLDVAGVAVANKYGALGANWTNVLQYDGVKPTGLATVQYVDYLAPAAGQTRFAYRDYTGASTVGGYYVPRVITTDLASDFDDLGRTFRVLTTGAKTPYNTTEVRKVYGVLWEITSGTNDYVVTESTANKLKAAVVDAMFASAVKATAGKTEAAIDSNIFKDGKAISYADAKAYITDNDATTAPYRAVDNNNDGIVDSLFLYTYKVGYVESVTDAAWVISGIGTLKFADYDANGAELKKGDYVVTWGDSQFKYIKALETYTGKVTKFNDNFPTVPATRTYTINGSAYTFGNLSLASNADERLYFEQLMGEGAASVLDVTLQYVFDGPFIVAVFKTTETYWENYAIVIGYNFNDLHLNCPAVRILTDDNEYKDFYLYSVGGTQLYNNVVAPNLFQYPAVNSLVRYSEVGTEYAALYAASQPEVSDQYSDDFGFEFDRISGNWIGHDYINSGVQTGTPFEWKNGVVFVSYGYRAHDQFQIGNMMPALQWRAYWFDEFQPFYWMQGEATDWMSNANRRYTNRQDGFMDEVVYADSLTNVMTLKAAAITFDYYNSPYELPGLVTRDGASFLATVMGPTSLEGTVSEDGIVQYVYTVPVLQPWANANDTWTFYSPIKNLTFVKGNVYKFFYDEDKIIRRWEDASAVYGLELGENYLEIGKFAFSSIERVGENYNLYIKIPSIHDGEFYADPMVLKFSADTNVYFTEGLFTTGIKSYDYVSFFNAFGSQFGGANDKSLTVYASYNPLTNEAYDLWINKEASPSTFKGEDAAITLVSYNEDTRKATYEIEGAYFLGTTSSQITVVQPAYQLYINVGETCYTDITYTMADNGGWYVDGTFDAATGNIKGIARPSNHVWVKYDATNAQSIKWTDNDRVKIFMNNNQKIAGDVDSEYTQMFWFRSAWTRTDALVGTTNAITGPWQFSDFNTVLDADQDSLIDANEAQYDEYDYNPNGLTTSDGFIDPYTYEEMWVMWDTVPTDRLDEGYAEDIMMVVFVDTQVAVDSVAVTPIAWPYNGQTFPTNIG